MSDKTVSVKTCWTCEHGDKPVAAGTPCMACCRRREAPHPPLPAVIVDNWKAAPLELRVELTRAEVQALLNVATFLMTQPGMFTAMALTKDEGRAMVMAMQRLRHGLVTIAPDKGRADDNARSVNGQEGA